MIDEIKKSGKLIPAVWISKRSDLITVTHINNNTQPNINLMALSLKIINPLDSDIRAFMNGKYKTAKIIAETTEVLNNTVVLIYEDQSVVDLRIFINSLIIENVNNRLRKITDIAFTKENMTDMMPKSENTIFLFLNIRNEIL